MAPHRWRRRFLLEDHALKPPQIAIVEQTADHRLRDLARALGIEHVAGCEVEPVIALEPHFAVRAIDDPPSLRPTCRPSLGSVAAPPELIVRPLR